jgi:hypothetical protein
MKDTRRFIPVGVAFATTGNAQRCQIEMPTLVQFSFSSPFGIAKDLPRFRLPICSGRLKAAISWLLQKAGFYNLGYSGKSRAARAGHVR